MKGWGRREGREAADPAHISLPTQCSLSDGSVAAIDQVIAAGDEACCR